MTATELEHQINRSSASSSYIQSHDTMFIKTSVEPIKEESVEDEEEEAKYMEVVEADIDPVLYE